MLPVNSTRILQVAVCLSIALWMSGCASVRSTAQFYIPTTTKRYPPKAKDAEVPLYGKAPDKPYSTIGKLVFESDQGWRFLRKSMEYNARIHGADAIYLKNTRVREQMRYVEVPPQTDWVPYPVYYRSNGQIYSRTNWLPVFRPGYVQPWLDRITAIDAEMIVFKK